MRKGIIDRFEGDFAVIEFDGVTEDVTKKELPKDCKVGDVLTFDQGIITIDKRETIGRRKEIDDLMDELFE